MGKIQENLVGLRVGRLAVVDGGDSTKKGKYWKCLCECGTTKFYTRQNLLKGTLKSCGCFKRECRGRHHKNWTGTGELGTSMVCKIKAVAKRRKIRFAVSTEYLWKLFLRQNRRCALTDVPLKLPESSWDVKHGKGTASLDRIDSSKGYVGGNVQWVHKNINMMKQNLTQTHFIEMCCLVSQKAKL